MYYMANQGSSSLRVQIGVRTDLSTGEDSALLLTVTSFLDNKGYTWSLKRQALLPSKATTRVSILELKRIWHAFGVHGQSDRTAAKADESVLDREHALSARQRVGKMHPLMQQTKVSSRVTSPHFTTMQTV